MPRPNLSWARRLLGLTLAVACGGVAAWGPSGHESVGAIADGLIAGTPTAKKVRQILGSNLRTASGWADCARSVESGPGGWTYTEPGKFRFCAVYENADSRKALVAFVQRNASRCGGWASSQQCRHKAFHFVNVPVQQQRYDPAGLGADELDLVQAINATLVVLQGGKSPPPFDIRGQREALRLLTHYIGDLHQPLHVGSIYLSDAGQPLQPATEGEARAQGNAGGNGLRMKGRSLHQLWDDVPDKMFLRLLGPAGLESARQVAATPGPLAQWPVAWADESIVAAAQAFAPLSFGPRPRGSAEWPARAAEPAYRQAREALQQEQLVKGGARLAQILRTLWP
jgi:hypothetical protein